MNATLNRSCDWFLNETRPVDAMILYCTEAKPQNSLLVVTSGLTRSKGALLSSSNTAPPVADIDRTGAHHRKHKFAALDWTVRLGQCSY